MVFFCIGVTAQKADIVLVLGASDEDKLETAKNLATKIIDMIPTKDTRFAIVQYWQFGMVISEFIQSDNKPVILERIRGREDPMQNRKLFYSQVVELHLPERS